MNAELTTDQICAIDTYLKNSGVNYIDVRAELVDHVACKVVDKMCDENLSFYDAFKWYMVENKRGLLTNFEQLKKKNQLRSFRLLWPWLKKPWMLALSILIFFLLYNYESFLGIEFPYSWVVWGFLFFMGLIYFVFTFPVKNNRYSGIEALSWFILMATYLFHFLYNIGRPEPLLNNYPVLNNLVTTMLMCVFIAWVISFFEQRRSFNKQYS